MTRRQLRRRFGALGMGVSVALICSLWANGAVGSAAPGAHAAKRKTITVVETADLHLDRKKGANLTESGSASGTLPGTVSARFNISNIAQVTGTVTFHPNGGGTITATVIAYPQSVGTTASFSGGLSVKSGTGRFAHASGGGSLTGTVNRKSWHVVVKTKKMNLTY